MPSWEGNGLLCCNFFISVCPHMNTWLPVDQFYSKICLKNQKIYLIEATAPKIIKNSLKLCSYGKRPKTLQFLESVNFYNFLT